MDFTDHLIIERKQRTYHTHETTWPVAWQYFPEETVGKTTANLDASEEIMVFFKRHEAP